MRDASDPEIYAEARAAGAVVMTKDQDFIRLLEVQGPPPQVLWLRLGNSSTMALKQVLSRPCRRQWSSCGKENPA